MSNSTIGFGFGWAFLLIISILAALIWYVSPLGTGFNLDPDNSDLKKDIGFIIYNASYFIGIPALLLAQGISGYIGFKGNSKKAIRISISALLLFITTASAALVILT